MGNIAEIIAQRVLMAKDSVAKGNSLCFCASQHLLDALASLIVGIRVGSYEAFLKCIGNQQGNIEVPGTDKKLSDIDAASVVAYQTHASVFEDGSRRAACHPAAAVFPVVWAMNRQGSLLDLIRGMVGGYEAMECIGSLGNPASIQRGFHPTGLCAPFGAAAAAGVLLNFDHETMAAALTLAASGSCGLMRAWHEGTTQPLHVSHGVRAGFIAALMAQQGLSGDGAILEKGFFPAYLGQALPDNLTDHHYFGKDWGMESCYLKPYPGCRNVHPSIDAMDQLLKSRAIKGKEIDSIHVDTYRVALDTQIHPVRSRGDAYFSIRYALAVRIILGRADWDAYDVRHLEDNEIKRLFGSVELSLDDRIQKAFPKERGARVTVILKSGEKLSAFQPLARGEPEVPLSFDETAEKFRREGERYLTAGAIDRIISNLREIKGDPVEIFRDFTFVRNG